MADMISTVESAIVGQLRAVQRGYAGLMVESYAGQLDDELFAWIRTLPATWVTFDQVQEPKRLGAHTFQVQASFEVLCAQRALTENAGRLNAASAGMEVGVYQLLHDNKLALANNKLGLSIGPLMPGAIRPVMKSMVNREAVAVYAQRFSTVWVEVYADADLVPPGELQTIGLSYYLKPQHSAAGDEADATDLMTIT
jgi:phage gp37-like protein